MPELLPSKARQLIETQDNRLYFSPASLWEVSIKSSQRRPDFQVDARIMRRQLLDSGYEELVITGLHTVAVSDLPDLHKDPVDRILVAQVKEEGIHLLTSDATIAEYPVSVLCVPKLS
jgi:PIN domain nuclease of toxin-antitoxin system